MMNSQKFAKIKAPVLNFLSTPVMTSYITSAQYQNLETDTGVNSVN